MKFAAVALILGCSALIMFEAGQSKHSKQISSVQTPAPAPGDGMVNRLEHFLEPKPQANRMIPSAAPATPAASGLTKAEAIKLIHKAAAKHRVPAAFVKSIIAAESNFNYAAMSHCGAVGFMQLMPETAAEFGATDPRVPEQNIDAGTKYLRYL